MRTEPELKVGDRVISNQPSFRDFPPLTYTGTIIKIGKKEGGFASVKRDDHHNILDRKKWSCRLLPDGKIATADGWWDGVSVLRRATPEQEAIFKLRR